MNEKALRQLSNSKSNQNIHEYLLKDREKLSDASGRLQLQYLSNLKNSNKTKRFNEDL